MLPALWQAIEAAPRGTPLPHRGVWDPCSNHDDQVILRLGRVLWKSAHCLGEVVA